VITLARWVTRRSTKRPIDVIVTDAKLRQGLVAVRSLGASGHTVGAVECVSTRAVPAFSSRWCAATARVEDRQTDPKLMVQQIIELASVSSEDVVVIPTHDGTIAAIQDRRTEVEARCALALARSEPLDAANDKRTTLALAGELGIRVPVSLTVGDEDEIPEAVRSIPMPAVLKPVKSWVEVGEERHRLGVRLARSPSEAGERLHAMLDLGAVVLLQSWIPGERLAVSFVRAGGSFYGEFAQVAHRMLPILGGDSVMRESVPLPEDAATAARRLVSELGLDGYAEVEFRRDADGTPVLMEINPRLSASIECAVRSGVDFPGLVRAWAADELPDPGKASYRTGVRVRWLAADVKWLFDNATQNGAPDTVPTLSALSTFFKEFAKPTGYDFFDARDLRPALIAVGSDLAWLGRTVKERFARAGDSR
jgi:predicted ATP-grasp superfamily ATP-dependent carboligase